MKSTTPRRNKKQYLCFPEAQTHDSKHNDFEVYT